MSTTSEEKPVHAGLVGNWPIALAALVGVNGLMSLLLGAAQWRAGAGVAIDMVSRMLRFSAVKEPYLIVSGIWNLLVVPLYAVVGIGLLVRRNWAVRRGIWLAAGGIFWLGLQYFTWAYGRASAAVEPFGSALVHGLLANPLYPTVIAGHALWLVALGAATAVAKRSQIVIASDTSVQIADVVTRKIVISGAMGALSMFLGATHLGFIPWVATAALTIMHLPVIAGAVLEGPLAGAAIGLIFGVFSLLQGAIAPTGPSDVWFINPLISIVPRLFIGPVAWLLYRTLHRANEPAALAVAGVAGSLTNTILVLGALGLFHFLPWALIGTIAVANGIPEAVAAAILIPALIIPWKRIETGRKGSTV